MRATCGEALHRAMSCGKSRCFKVVIAQKQIERCNSETRQKKLPGVLMRMTNIRRENQPRKRDLRCETCGNIMT